MIAETKTKTKKRETNLRNLDKPCYGISASFHIVNLHHSASHPRTYLHNMKNKKKKTTNSIITQFIIIHGLETVLRCVM
jgi:hypothetical protein